MKQTLGNKRPVWILLPLIGIFTFACLYIIATIYYPGGSQGNLHSEGFSWVNNYWCNLLNETAMNGKPNAVRQIALSAMFILCLSLAFFWYVFPRLAKLKKNICLTIQISGIAAMVTGLFLFTSFHDTIINIASLFGLVAIIGTFAGLSKLKWIKLLRLGIFDIALVALNNILYYGEGLKLYLPIVQKITFLFFLVWIGLIDLKLYRKY